MTDEESQKLITTFVTAYPDYWRWLDEKQQAATRKLYRHMMRDLDAKSCAAACARIIATSRKMPTISEVREVTMQQTIGRRIVGGEAWGSVQKAIAREGIQKRPGKDFVWLDPVTARTVDAMGWQYLCGITDERAVADRARFIELYEQLARQAHEDGVVAELAPPIPRHALASAQSLGALVQNIVKALPESEPEPDQPQPTDQTGA